jgi:hypothetical protein
VADNEALRGRKIVTWAGPAVALWLTGYALFYLAKSLLEQYSANHWPLVWIGLDLVMAVLAMLTWWFVRAASPLAAVTASSLGTLFLVDAWFDCLTASSRDLPQSLISLAVEIPAALYSWWIALAATRRHAR